MKPGEIVKKHAREIAIVTAISMGGGAIALASGEGDHGATAAVETTLLTNAQEQTAAELCADGFDMSVAPSVEFAEANVGSPESLFTDFSVTTAEGTTLISVSEFADKFLSEVCVKPDALAAVMAYAIEPAGYNDDGKLFFPDSATIARVQKLAKLYRDNPGEALDAITTIASVVKAPAGVLKNTFVVPDGSGSIVAPARDENGAYGIETIELPVDGAIDVFQFGFSVARTDLTEDERKILRQLSELVGFDAQGRMLLSRWIGQSEVDLTPEEETDDTILVATSVDPSAPSTTGVNPNQTSTSIGSAQTSTSVAGEAPATATTTGSGENGQTDEGDGNGNDNSDNGGGHGNRPGQTSTPDAPGHEGGETPTDVPGNPETTVGGTTPGTGSTPNTGSTPRTTVPGSSTTAPTTTVRTTTTTGAPTTTTTSTTTTAPATTTTRPTPTTTIPPQTTLPKGGVPTTTGCDEFNPCN